MKALRLLVCAASACVASACASSTLALEGSDLYRFQAGAEPRWVSPENPTGANIGTAWGQGAYINRFQGAPIADEARGRWTFYRFHIPDPLFFSSDIEVSLQQLGGARKAVVLDLQQRGVPLTPVTIDPGSRNNFQQLLSNPKPLSDPTLPDGHTNFYRSDDVAAVAYFYLDRPEGALPPLAAAAERLAALRPPAPPEQK